jgi:hypothetical protein
MDGRRISTRYPGLLKSSLIADIKKTTPFSSDVIASARLGSAK